MTRLLFSVSFFLPMTFNENIFLEMPLLTKNNYCSSQIQRMDRKYNGHVWSKVITTNIKNNFGLNFRKVHCLGHLHCVHDNMVASFVQMITMRLSRMENWPTFWSKGRQCQVLFLPCLDVLFKICFHCMLMIAKVYYVVHRL